MCLSLNLSKTKKAKRETGTFTYWKLLFYNPRSQSIESIFKRKWWKKGVNTSDREQKALNEFELDSRFVHHGIHVYTRKPADDARGYLQFFVPVRCRRRDLVAWGFNSEAVYTQVRITTKDWNELLRQITKSKTF